MQGAVDERLLDEIKKASNLVVPSVKKNTLTPEKLRKRFKKVKNNEERARKIVESYQEGYSLPLHPVWGFRSRISIKS
jgi:hypothetical protein